MDRRELLKGSAALACVAAVPTLRFPLFAQTKPTWNESATSAAAMEQMKPLLAKFNKAKGAHSLTASEWDDFAEAHKLYFDEHHRLGDMAKVDAYARANEARLKARFDHDGINYLIEHGSHNVLSQVPIAFHHQAEKIRAEPYQPASLFSCSGFWSSMGLVAFILGIFFPEIALFCGFLVAYYGVIDIFACP